MEKITYDAFISYSHSEPDSFVAEKLHSMLEHYHISKKLQEISGKKKISRVFRDREELPLSSDLGANICQALKNSEYLIVVCSPRAVKSEWVQREIEIFLETHEKNKILTLLVDGEPEESFPEILCYSEEKLIGEDREEKIVRKSVEPMAADIRGSTKREIRKKLKEEFLRILAPMLSCTYDTLRQRHREYFFQRAMAMTGTAAVLAVLFTLYAFHQASVSESRYQEARRNQARYLSEISGELLASGDRKGAIQTVLAIQPEESEETEAVVPEQMYALNNALYSYNTGARIDFKAENSFELTGKTRSGSANENGTLSPDETGYFCVDQQGNAYILDPEDGQCMWKIAPGDLEGAKYSGSLYFYPASEDKAVLITACDIIYIDWKEQRVLNVISADADESPGYLVNCIFDVWGTRAAAADGEKIWVYDLESGECLYQSRYAGEGTSGYEPKLLSFQDDGSMLVLGVGDDYFNVEENAGLFLLSMDDGSIRMISEENTEKMVFLEDGRIAAIQYSYPEGMSELSDSPERFFHTVVYDTEAGEQIWASEVYRTQAIGVPCTLAAETMKVNGEPQEILASSIKDRISIFDADDGSVIQDRSFPSDIEGVSIFDENRFLAGLSNGQIMICIAGEMLTNYSGGAISAEIGDFLYSPKYGRVIWTVNDSHRIVFGKIFEDENMKDLSLEETISDVEYFTVDDGSGRQTTYRCVLYQTSGYGAGGLAVYKAGSSERLFDYRLDSEADSIFDVNIMNIDGEPYVLFSGSGALRRPVSGNLKTGEVTSELSAEEQDFTDSSMWNYFEINYFKTASKAIVYDSSKFAVADITKHGLSVPDAEDDSISLSDETSRIEEILLTADDRYAVLIVRSYGESSYGEEYGIRIWDIENESWTEMSCLQALALKSGTAAVGHETDKAAVLGEDGTIEILDLLEGEILCSLPYGDYEQVNFAFMNHDRYLICCGDDNRLTLWDTEKGEMLMENEDSSVPLSSLYTDSNGDYFAAGFYGYEADNSGLSTSQLRIYYVDDSGRFYHFADVPYGYVSFEADEIFAGNRGGRYGQLYTYDELRARAEQLIDGEILSDAEKRQYFISE